ncbi:MAG: glycosyltransferase family 39 protein [Chloroflexota bacterium]|nr:glycosyltransferase family 39 protein [Chloroflexota bacterium]MDE2918784.1 glycosyltransferase family 39 protein [Chloroflexota bacterium]
MPCDATSNSRQATDISASTQLRLAIAIITFATLHALLWSFVRDPGGGGPDEGPYFAVVSDMASHGAIPEFTGYAPGAFAGGPVRAQVAREITPNFLAIPIAFVIGTIGSSNADLNIQIARMFMVALYPVTLWLSFLTLRRLFSDTRIAPVWGVAVMATVPMFTLVHTYYTNDAPAIAAGTFATYALVRASQSGFGHSDTYILGISLGLVALHKYTGFLIFPATAAIVIWQFLDRPRRTLQIGLTLFLITASISSWWYIRNLVIYGDPTGVAVTQAAVDASGGAPIPPRTRGLTPIAFVQETNWIGENFATFWAGYGQKKLKLPGAAYLAFGSFIIAATIGGALRFLTAIRQGRLSTDVHLYLVLATMHLGLWLLSFWSSYTVDVALSGRYVFPTFLSFIVILILGLQSFVVWRGRVAATMLLTVPIMIASSGAYFFQTILPDVNT